MSVEIPANIQMEIDAVYEPNQTGQILLNVYQGKVVSAELKRHIKAEAGAPGENGQGLQKNSVDNLNASP